MRCWAKQCCVKLLVAGPYIGLKHITMLGVYNKGRIENKSNACSIPYNKNHPQKKNFANFANLEAFTNVFLYFLSLLEFLYNEITWIANVFPRTTAKKAICETFLPWMIPVIRYLIHHNSYYYCNSTFASRPIDVCLASSTTYNLLHKIHKRTRFHIENKAIAFCYLAVVYIKIIYCSL